MSLFFLSSCFNSAKLVEKNGVIIVRAPSFGIEKLREISWKVGPYRKQEVSKGIRIAFSLPKLSDSALKTLLDKDVDGYLIRLKREGSGRLNTLGYFSLVFGSNKSKSRKKIRNISTGSIGVNFSAAAISTRLTNLKCPALSHRKKITSLEINKKLEEEKNLLVDGISNEVVNAKVQSINYGAVVLNGGKSLFGKYYLELAFYNSQEKRRRSSYIRLANVASVLKSKEVKIRGCENFVTPPRDENPSRTRKFKFGR